jgi:hypothetical protein
VALNDTPTSLQAFNSSRASALAMMPATCPALLSVEPCNIAAPGEVADLLNVFPDMLDDLGLVREQATRRLVARRGRHPGRFSRQLDLHPSSCPIAQAERLIPDGP